MTATLDQAAADPQQTIAKLQRQLDERTAERDEALERETATAEVLQVINSSPGDLAPVFDAMLEKAMQLCEAAFGELHTYDGERFHTAALRGVPAAYAEVRAKTPPSGRPGTGAARILEARRPVHILDLMAGEGYQTNCGSAPATSRSRLNTRPRPATCSRSSAVQRSICNPCWTRSLKPPPAYVSRKWLSSGAETQMCTG